MDTGTSIVADRVIAILRAHEAELRQAGIRALSLFGSVARGDAQADSDIDLAAEFDPRAKMDLLRLVGLERRLGEILGRKVDLVPEPAEKPHCGPISRAIAAVPFRPELKRAAERALGRLQQQPRASE